jgi:hypothetical protein
MVPLGHFGPTIWAIFLQTRQITRDSEYLGRKQVLCISFCVAAFSDYTHNTWATNLIRGTQFCQLDFESESLHNTFTDVATLLPDKLRGTTHADQ